jgi:hypothetical protein
MNRKSRIGSSVVFHKGMINPQRKPRESRPPKHKSSAVAACVSAAGMMTEERISPLVIRRRAIAQ